MNLSLPSRVGSVTEAAAKAAVAAKAGTQDTGICGAFVQFTSLWLRLECPMLRSGEYSAHVRWSVTVAIALGSVGALNALIVPSTDWTWLWMLQAITPSVTFNVLGSLVTNVRQSQSYGERTSVVTALSSVVSVSVFTLLYVTLIALDAPGGVFYVALVTKLLLWPLGHRIILQAQLYMRVNKNVEIDLQAKREC